MSWTFSRGCVEIVFEAIRAIK